MTALVLHLDGPPGVGKSTLARRWADAHPGTLVVEADALRTWVSGWRGDFVAVGSKVRPVTLAMITAYAAQGFDVVVPQLVADAGELALFRRAATDAGARFLPVFLESAPGEAERRFRARPHDEAWLEEVDRLVAAAGPDEHARYEARLAELAAGEADVVRVSTTGTVDAAYDALVAVVERAVARS